MIRKPSNKQLLEQRVMEVLTSNFKSSCLSFIEGRDYVLTIGLTRGELHHAADASTYGSAATFNSIISQALKAGLIHAGEFSYGKLSIGGPLRSAALVSVLSGEVTEDVLASIRHAPYWKLDDRDIASYLEPLADNRRAQKASVLSGLLAPKPKRRQRRRANA